MSLKLDVMVNMVRVVAVRSSADRLWNNPDSIIVLLWIPRSISRLSLGDALSSVLDIKINTEVRNCVWFSSITTFLWLKFMVKLFFSQCKIGIMVLDFLVNAEVWYNVVHLDLLGIGFWVEVLGHFTERRGDWIGIQLHEGGTESAFRHC